MGSFDASFQSFWTNFLGNFNCRVNGLFFQFKIEYAEFVLPSLLNHSRRPQGNLRHCGLGRLVLGNRQMGRID